MCTNFTPVQKPQWVKDAFDIDLPAAYAAETYPGFAAPIVVQSHQTGRVACGLAKFGLIPAWAKDDKISRHTYNARSETVTEKPSYRTAWRKRQFGLVLVENFFEPRYESGRAVRWKIGLASGDPFGIACLWDRWTDPSTGELVVSFSMLTVNADEHPVMNQFHQQGDEKRTPVIIAPEFHKAWLGAETMLASKFMSWQNMQSLHAQASPRPSN
jgi:putative SOS response-associated peptidase YedK